MEKIGFSDGVGILGIVLAIVLLVLDKAGKLKGGWLFGLLCLAAGMTLFIALGNTWVMDSPSQWKLWRNMFMVALVCLVYSGLAIWIAEPIPSRSAETTKNPSISPTNVDIAPAGFISFVGIITGGKAPMIQENQTDTPLDDVRLTINGVIPKSESPVTFEEWGTGGAFWNRVIDVGTVRALLTTGIGGNDERFPIPLEEDHIFFYIFMETRLRSYQERIYLAKKSDRKYEARIEFGFPDKPSYTRTQIISVSAR